MGGTDETGATHRSAPGVRDYGWALVAALAGLMVLFVIGGTTWNLTTEGVSVPVVLGLCFNLLFWSWIGIGAWRRTVWSRVRPGR